MEKLTLFYSVENGGDGSAYPKLFESIALAEIDQEHAEDSWGECCNGTFTVESESPIICTDHIISAKEVKKEILEELDYEWNQDYPEYITRLRLKLLAVEKLIRKNK